MRTVALLTLLAATASFGEEVLFQRHYVDGRYGQLHVLTSSPAAVVESLTPMVCFAPNPMAGRYFRLFMQDLGRDRVMHAPDYPGLGRSDPPPEPLDMAGYADAMAEVIEALGYGPGAAVDICGYHSGAMVAIELAVRRPELVRKIVLAGVPYYTGAARQAMYEENFVAVPLSEDFESLRATWEFTVVNRQPGVSLERGFGNFVDILEQRQRTHWLYHAVFSYAAGQQVRKVSQPVLILNTHGSLEDETRSLAPLFADAQLIEIPELEHGIFDVGAALLSRHIRERID